MKIRLIQIGLFFAGLLPAFHSAAQEFQASGMLTEEFVNASNGVSQERTEHFEISVRDCQWFITTTPYPLNKTNWVWKIGSEGSNVIYQTTKFNEANSDSVNDSVGEIENDSVPNNVQGDVVSEIWLAYASACYLDSVTNNRLKPAYSLIDHDWRFEDYTVKADWKRFDSPPRLPQQIIYYEDKGVGFYGGKVREFPLPPPYTNGYTRAEYDAIATTNVGGLVIPRQFSFKEYAVMQTSSTNSHLMMWRVVTGWLSDAQPICERETFIPDITEPTYVEDDRFSKSNQPNPIAGMAYMITNGEWPSTNSPLLQKLYQHELFAEPDAVGPAPMNIRPRHVHPGQTGSKRKVVIMLVGLSLCSVIFFLVKGWRKS